jgi:hypothetical protein
MDVENVALSSAVPLRCLNPNGHELIQTLEIALSTCSQSDQVRDSKKPSLRKLSYELAYTRQALALIDALWCKPCPFASTYSIAQFRKKLLSEWLRNCPDSICKPTATLTPDKSNLSDNESEINSIFQLLNAGDLKGAVNRALEAKVSGLLFVALIHHNC